MKTLHPSTSVWWESQSNVKIQRYRQDEKECGAAREREKGTGKRLDLAEPMYVNGLGVSLSRQPPRTDSIFPSWSGERAGKLLLPKTLEKMFLMFGPKRSADKKMFWVSSGNKKQKSYVCVCKSGREWEIIGLLWPLTVMIYSLISLLPPSIQ